MDRKSLINELLGIYLSCGVSASAKEGTVSFPHAMSWRDEVLPSPAQMGAESSSSSQDVPRAPQWPFSVCPRREIPANSRDTPEQLYKTAVQGRRVGQWGTAIRPPSDRAECTLLHQGFVFSFLLDWITVMGAMHENMTQRGSSVAHSIAGPVA